MEFAPVCIDFYCHTANRSGKKSSRYNLPCTSITNICSQPFIIRLVWIRTVEVTKKIHWTYVGIENVAKIFFIRARESTRYERGGNWHHSITNCEQFVKINTTISIIWFTHRMRKTTTGSFYIDSTFKRFSEKYVRNYKISSNTQKLWCF